MFAPLFLVNLQQPIIQASGGKLGFPYRQGQHCFTLTGWLAGCSSPAGRLEDELLSWLARLLGFLLISGLVFCLSDRRGDRCGWQLGLLSD